jgi:hypothetical protein
MFIELFDETCVRKTDIKTIEIIEEVDRVTAIQSCVVEVTLYCGDIHRSTCDNIATARMCKERLMGDLNKSQE